MNHFTHYNNCPTCNECLDGEKEGTFQELLVGVAPNPLIDSLYQNAYSDADHSAIGHQILWALNGCREILTTHLTQLGLEISRHQSSAAAVETRRVQEVSLFEVVYSSFCPGNEFLSLEQTIQRAQATLCQSRAQSAGDGTAKHATRAPVRRVANSSGTGVKNCRIFSSSLPTG